MLAIDTGLQQELFGVQDNFQRPNGHLTTEAIARLKQIDKDLRSRGSSLEAVSKIPKATWNNWLYCTRLPTAPALAFLTLLLAQPEHTLHVLNKFTSVGATTMMQ